MRLKVFNGSPRGEESTTTILLKHFLNGFITTDGNTYEMDYLNRVKVGFFLLTCTVANQNLCKNDQALSKNLLFHMS